MGSLANSERCGILLYERLPVCLMLQDARVQFCPACAVCFRKPHVTLFQLSLPSFLDLPPGLRNVIDRVVNAAGLVTDKGLVQSVSRDRYTEHRACFYGVCEAPCSMQGRS